MTGDERPDPVDPVDIGREAAREAARDELSRSEYSADDGNPVVEFVGEVLDRLGAVLARVGEGTPGGYPALVVLLVLAAAGVVLLRRRLGPLRSRRTGPAVFPGAGGPVTAAGHRAAADAHAAAGRWADAVQERVRAIVRSLEERAVLDERPGRTAGEAAAEAGRMLPAVAPGLRAAARLFDDVRYGGRTATEAMDRELRAIDDRCAAARAWDVERDVERVP